MKMCSGLFISDEEICEENLGTHHNLEVFEKTMGKVVQAGLGTGARLFWEVLVQFPAMGRGKPIENGQTGVRESFLGTTPA